MGPFSLENVQEVFWRANWLCRHHVPPHCRAAVSTPMPLPTRCSMMTNPVNLVCFSITSRATKESGAWCGQLRETEQTATRGACGADRLYRNLSHRRTPRRC